jgi:insulysin
VHKHLVHIYCCFGSLLLIAMLQSAMAETSSETPVIKSPADHREYAPLTLDNGLQVMLVSDAEADEAAAAMDVYVGSGDDPDDREGLAHYLEHMLFLGTEKYPEAGEYQKFIRQHGGRNNAYTVLSNTNYYFSIDPDFFEPALDRFAQFFIAPLFNKDNVQRERSVVDSEYRARVKDEGRRLWAARGQVYNPAHPATGFSVGSLDTLADREDDLVRDDLIAFYKQHYHSAKMRLVVVSKEPIEQLRTWVVEKFSALPKAQAERESFSEPLFLPGVLPKKLTLKPLKEARRVTFSFPVASADSFVDNKPLHYLSNLIGHEGEGSLLAELKKRAWANGLSAGRGYMDEVQGSFDISISLSPEGLKHIDEIGEMLFGYLALVKQQGIKERYFQEQKQLAELDFKFMEQSSPQSLAQSLASRLQRFSAAEVLIAPYSYKLFDEELISAYLETMTPHNLLLSIVDPSLQSEKLTPWYDVEFSLVDIDKTDLQLWENARQVAWMQMPSINPFIPVDTDLLPGELAQKNPTLLNSSSGLDVWHQTLLEYEQPKSEFYFSVQSPFANSDPRSGVLTQLYVDAVNEGLNSFTYAAYLAGLGYDMYPHSRGFSVRISGYSDKQHTLLERILEALSIDELAEVKFEQIKQNLRQGLENSFKGRPSDVLMSGVYEVLLSSNWSTEEELTALSTITLKELLEHSKRIFKDIQVTTLSAGNVSEEQTQNLASLLSAQFDDKLSESGVPRSVVRQFANGQVIYREKSLTHPDSALALYFQGRDKSVKEQAITQILSAAMGPDFYQNLRTENEIGYLVQAFAFNLLEVPAMAVSIQSSSHSVGETMQLVDTFLQSYLEKLQALTPKELETTKAGVISQLLQKDKTLNQAARRAWREIDRKNENFNSRENLIEALQAIDQQSLVSFHQERILSKQRSELLLVHYGDKGTKMDERIAAEVLKDHSLQQLRDRLKDTFPPY